MNFEINKINPSDPRKPRGYTRHITISASLIVSISIIILLLSGIAKALSAIDFSVFLSLAGANLETDAYDHTNFLLIGTGGENHSGGDLTDTIIVASLDQKNKLVSMVSIPRDLYVEDKKIGGSRINTVYFNAKNYFGSSSEGLDYFKTKMEELLGIPIHYWVKIDFAGFKDLVDAVGGIDVDVKETIVDPFYPKDGTTLYETFSISTGQHHLDGETALKYARSRETTSDFSRSDRQQQIIYAIKDQALKTNVILSKDKIENIFDALKNNIETNLQIKEMLTLGLAAKNYSSDQILQRLVHDDPSRCGGFLYTPDRELYQGAFVLLPAGDQQQMQKYFDLNFNFQKDARSKTRIQILNSTPRGGVAAETKQILRRFCFEINRFGNGRSKNLEKTTYYYKQKQDSTGRNIDSRPDGLDFLQKIIPGEESMEIPDEYLEYIDGTDLILELGIDYVNSPNYLEDEFYSLPAIPKKEDGEAENSTETSTVETTPSPSTPD